MKILKVYPSGEPQIGRTLNVKPRRRKRRGRGNPGGGGTDWSSYWSSLISATVETAAPTKVVLTFPVAQPTLVDTDFTIAGKTISNATWGAAVLTLTVSVTFDYGDAPVVTFVKTGDTANVTNNITYPLALYDGHTVGWYDSQELSTITKDGSDFVSIWYDKIYGSNTLGAELNSGNTVISAVYIITATQSNYFYAGCKIGDTFIETGVRALSANNKVKRYTGNQLVQPTGTAQPQWILNDGVLFDGVDNKMITAAFTYAQPEFIYMVGRQVTWTNSDYILDGSSAETMNMLQAATTPGLKARASTLSAQNDNLAVNTWGIVRLLFNGASSKLIVNASAATTWDCGASNGGLITLCCRGANASNYGNFQFKEAIFRNTSDSSGTEALIYLYLKTKYGL